MLIGGLQKFSLLDYPGHMAAIIFAQGCNFRCPFCYNPLLVWPPRKAGKVKDKIKKGKGHTLIRENDLFLFLGSRRGKLDGVVISGGEPTLQKDLPEFCQKIKAISGSGSGAGGFLIKLDTNGTKSKMLKNLIDKKLIDYIAMDIKAPAAKYAKVTGTKIGTGSKSGTGFKNILESVKIIIESGLPYEFRTTVVPSLLVKTDIAKIGKLLKGADRWYLQKFKPNTELVDKNFEKVRPYTDKEMKEMQAVGRKYVKKCEVR